MDPDPRKLPEHFHDSADDGENIHRRPEDAPAQDDDEREAGADAAS